MIRVTQADCKLAWDEFTAWERGQHAEPPSNGEQVSKEQAKPATRLTIQELAGHVQLSLDQLTKLKISQCGDVVRIKYGDSCRPRYRRELHGDDRYRWGKDNGTPIIPYGVDPSGPAKFDDEKYRILVEGETDCWTLWLANLPALGIPGSGMIKRLTIEHLAGITSLCVVKETKGGEGFVDEVVAHLIAIGFAGEIKIIETPDGKKDPCELWKSIPESESKTKEFRSLMYDATTKGEVVDRATWKPSAPAGRGEPMGGRNPAGRTQSGSGNGKYNGDGGSYRKPDLRGIDIRPYLEQYFGPFDKNGKCRCGYHADKNPSGTAYEKDGIWYFKCHANGCGKHADVIDILRDHGGMSYREAMAEIGQPLPEPEQKKTTKRGRKKQRRESAPGDDNNAQRDDSSSQQSTDTRTRIIVTTNEEIATQEATQALATRDDVYVWGDRLATVRESKLENKFLISMAAKPRPHVLHAANIRNKLSACIQWFAEDGPGGSELRELSTPVWAVKAIETQADYPSIRVLTGVVEVPMMRADGSILTKPGYDPLTGIYYSPSCVIPSIPHKPTLDDAKQAVALLQDLVVDFPLKEECDFSAWLAALLTLFSRYSFHGPAPQFHVDANIRGAGKGKLIDVIANIFSSGDISRASIPDANDEVKKMLTAVIVIGEAAVYFDNLVGTYGCKAMDAVLTATSWSDRLLGESKWINDVPIKTTFLSSGNNIQMKGDIARRIQMIRLDSELERPETRSGFRHPNILAHVKQHRPALIAAVLTILRHGFIAPKQKLTSWGSYEEWSTVVRQAIVAVELPDPYSACTEMVELSDDDSDVLGLLITGWIGVTQVVTDARTDDPFKCGMSVSKAIQLIQHENEANRAANVNREPTSNAYPSLREAFTVLGLRGEDREAKRLGAILKKFRRRIFEPEPGRKFRLDHKRNGKIGNVWYVEVVE